MCLPLPQHFERRVDLGDAPPGMLGDAPPAALKSAMIGYDSDMPEQMGEEKFDNLCRRGSLAAAARPRAADNLRARAV